MSKRELNVLENAMRVLSTRRDYDTEKCAHFIWQQSSEISAFFIKEGYRRQGDIRAFAKYLATDVLSEAIHTVSKENTKEDSQYAFPIEFASFLSEGVDHINKMYVEDKLKLDKENYQRIVQRYRETIFNILQPRIGLFTSHVTDSSIAATELLSVVPVPQIIYEDRVLGPYVGKVIQKLVLMSTTFVKMEGGNRPLFVPFDKGVVQDIFEFLFGSERMPEVARAVLSSYNNGILPNEEGECKLILFASDIFESMDSKQLKKELKEIVNFKVQRDSVKSLRIDKVNLNEYPRLKKRIIKMVTKNEKAATAFEEVINNSNAKVKE